MRSEDFQAGFRGEAAAETEGSGLGLSLVKQFVEEHGGSVEVDNIAGRGARFKVKLPGSVLDVPAVAADGTISLL